MDFQNDHLEDGSGFKIASILDEHTRLTLDDTVDTSITGEDLVVILDRLALEHGLPVFLRMDNGPETGCNAVAEWADGVVGLVFIPPGDPRKNGNVESFHSRQRDEFVNVNTFASLFHARVELADWHHQYDHVRRHSSPGYTTPPNMLHTVHQSRLTPNQTGPRTGGGSQRGLPNSFVSLQQE